MKRPFRKGQMVSIWHRESKRHKWRLDRSMVRIIFISDEGVGVQTSDTYCQTRRSTGELLNGYNGGTSLRFKGEGTWERELRAPVYDWTGAR